MGTCLGRMGWMLVWLLPGLGLAQSGEDWQPLHSQGLIPEYFLQSYAEQYERRAAQIASLAPQRIAREEAYYQGQVYQTRQLLLSGQVLFGDEGSRYLSRIADQLLRAQPDLRAQLHFHVVLSPSVNAFASGQGYIFVNVGLLARVRSEAELAFILSHEIAHYVKQHALNLFLQIYREPEGRFNPQSQALTQQLVDRNTYSQEAEIEADTWGTRLFLSSGYDLTAIGDAFALLDQADDLPSVNALHLPNLLPASLRERWTLTNEAPIDFESLPNEPGTHPIPLERWQRVEKQIDGFPTEGRPAFLQIKEETFQALRQRSRYTLARLYLHDRQYEAALLLLDQLIERHPVQRPHLQAWVAYAWYGLARHANAGRFYDVHRAPLSEQRGVYQLLELTERMDAEALTDLALRWLWQLDPTGEDLLLGTLAEDLRGEWQALYAQAGDGATEAFAVWREQEGAALLGSGAPTSVSVERTRLGPAEREQLLQGLNLSLERLAFVSPDYLQYDERSFVPIHYQKSLARREDLHHDLMQFAAGLGHQPQLLRADDLDRTDRQALADLGLLRAWLRHQQRPEDVVLVSPYHAEIVALCQRLGTETFVWLDFYIYTQERVAKPLVLAAGILLPLLLPYSLYYILTPRYSTVMFMQIYQLPQYKTLLQLPRIIEMRDRRDVVRSTLYDVLAQLK